MSEPQQIDARMCVVRDTAARPGRHISIQPGRTAARHLHYGRIILDGDSVAFDTENRETALIGLKGNGRVECDGQAYDVGQYDALYISRDTRVTVSGSCDLAEVAAPVDQKYPVQFVRFADVKRDPALSFDTGGESSRRNLNILIGKNV